jgi:hypothetical protein
MFGFFLNYSWLSVAFGFVVGQVYHFSSTKQIGVVQFQFLEFLLIQIFV